MLRMARTPGMWAKAASQVLPLGECKIDPFDEKVSRPIALGDTDQPGQGELTLTIAPVFVSTSASLRVERSVKAGLLKKAAWVPFWLVLIKGVLHFVDSNLMVTEEKTLAALEPLAREGAEVMVAEKGGGGKSEVLRLTDEEAHAARFFQKVTEWLARAE